MELKTTWEQAIFLWNKHKNMKFTTLQLDNRKWVTLEYLEEQWNNLMDKTDDLHNLDCGSCDKNIQEFKNKLFGN